MRRPVTKREVAAALEEIARYLDLDPANGFRSRAYANAARKIEQVDGSLEHFIASGEIDHTSGIGKATRSVIVELVQQRRSAYLDELRSRYPSAIFDLMQVPGLGMRKIGVLYEKLGIATTDDLEQALRAGRVAALPGFSKKTEQKLLSGIDAMRTTPARFLLPNALEAAEGVVEIVRKLDGVADVVIAGEVRRRLETVSRVEICVSCRSEKAAAAALRSEGFSLVEAAGDELTRFRGRGRFDVPVELTLTNRSGFGAALLITTGGDRFVRSVLHQAKRKGFDIGVRGVRSRTGMVAAPGEDELFKAIAVRGVPPELREDDSPPPPTRSRGRLVEPEDLRGTFHAHTTYSDGRATLYEMVDGAADRGFEYLGISDHSKLAAYAGGLTEERVTEQRREIENLRKRLTGIRIFHGTEADILADGEIDYGPETLAQFDFVIASVHSKFKTPKEEMTARIVRALRNRYVTFLGHLTGRLLLSRSGYQIDYDEVFSVAAEEGVMIEINGNPHRLELDWRLLQQAREAGVRFSIHPDAHSVESLGHVITGTWTARKGALTPRDVFNTLTVEEVERHFAERKQRAQQRGV